MSIVLDIRLMGGGREESTCILEEGKVIYLGAFKSAKFVHGSSLIVEPVAYFREMQQLLRVEEGWYYDGCYYSDLDVSARRVTPVRGMIKEQQLCNWDPEKAKLPKKSKKPTSVSGDAAKIEISNLLKLDSQPLHRQLRAVTASHKALSNVPDKDLSLVPAKLRELVREHSDVALDYYRGQCDPLKAKLPGVKGLCLVKRFIIDKKPFIACVEYHDKEYVVFDLVTGEILCRAPGASLSLRDGIYSCDKVKIKPVLLDIDNF